MKKVYEQWKMQVTEWQLLDILTLSNANDFFDDELPPVEFN